MTRIASAQWLDLVTLACSALRSRVPAGASPATSGGPENGTCGRFPVPGGGPCHRADFHPVLTELTRQPLSGELAGFHQPTGPEQPFQLCSSTSPSLACSFEQRRGVRQEGWHLPGQLLQDRIGILSHLGFVQRADQVPDPVVEVSELGPVPRFFSPSLATVPSASSRVPPACAACLRRTVPGVCPRPVGGGPDHPDTARSRRNLAALTAELDNGP